MFLGSKVRPVRGADNVGSLTSHNPIGLHGVTGIILLLLLLLQNYIDYI
jgi:hypothetical protein